MRGSVHRDTSARAASTPRLRLLIALLIAAAVGASVVGVEAASLPLTWNAPTTSGDGSPLTDLSGYRVYLGTSAPTCPSGSFHAVASPTPSPSSGQTVSTRIIGLGAGTTYFARVTAVDFSGNESTCSGSASGVAQADFTVTPTSSTAFGSITVNGTVDRTFTVQNTSTTSISVTTAVSAPFGVLSGGSFSLAAGASQAVTIRFRPTTVGSFAGNVNFTASGDTVSRAVSGSSTPVPTVSLSVTKNGTGTGTVTSAPAGVACGSDCSEALAVGTPVTLTVTAASGSVFAGWSGACSGTAPTCAWTMSAATAVTATFNTNRVDRPLDPPVPVVSSLSPLSIAVRSAGLTLTVNGTGFAAVSVVRWNGANRATTFVSSTQLRATITATDLLASGLIPVSVFTPAPGGGTSGTVNFSVIAPAPVASSLSPTSAVAGTAGVTLTVNGSGFVPASVVRWNGAARPTTFGSATRLQAAISAADLATAGSIPVSVFTPTPGGGTSAIRLFTITASTTPVTPPAVPGMLSITMRGGDASGVTFDVAWGAASGATSYRYVAAFSDGTASQQGTVTGLLSFQLRMPYHASGATFGGYVCIRSVGVTGLQSADQACGGVSVPARPAAAPVPVASSLAPASAVAGSAGIMLTVNGSGFASTSVVRWNGAPRPTTVVSATQLRATLSAADLAAAGSIPVSVFTPAPGGGTSGSQTFVITAPSPTPSTPPAAPGSPSVTLRGVDAAGATFDMTWSAASGAASYSYFAALSDGSSSQQGTVTGPSLQLRMPYHRTGGSFGGFVCIRSIGATGLRSADQACGALTIPAP